MGMCCCKEEKVTDLGGLEDIRHYKITPSDRNKKIEDFREDKIKTINDLEEINIFSSETAYVRNIIIKSKNIKNILHTIGGNDATVNGATYVLKEFELDIIYFPDVIKQIIKGYIGGTIKISKIYLISESDHEQDIRLYDIKITQTNTIVCVRTFYCNKTMLQYNIQNSGGELVNVISGFMDKLLKYIDNDNEDGMVVQIKRMLLICASGSKKKIKKYIENKMGNDITGLEGSDIRTTYSFYEPQNIQITKIRLIENMEKYKNGKYILIGDISAWGSRIIINSLMINKKVVPEVYYELSWIFSKTMSEYRPS